MYCNVKSSFAFVVFILCLILISSAEAQLNFSTGWGKRSQNIQTGASSTGCPSQGRPSLEQLLNLYNIIQIEAQRILDCQKLDK